MEYPLISALVLCYNQAPYIVECLESIKTQDYPNLEIIINDDASKDDSVAIIQSWLSKNTIPHCFLRNETNQGICRSLNNLVRHSKGKYLSGIATDDVWLPGKLRGQVEMMEQLPANVCLVYSDALQMDQNGNLLPGKFMEVDGRLPGSESAPQGNVQVALWRGNFIAPMTTLIRRECLDRVGPYDETLFAEDWDMWLRLSRHYDFTYSPVLSAKYRIVANSATRKNYGRLWDYMCQTCVKHLKSGQLEPEARRAAIAKLHAVAGNSFVEKSTRHKQYLIQALKYRPTAGMFARCLLAWSGLNAGGFQRVRSMLRRESPPGPDLPAIKKSELKKS
jgi:glycosyltransferase involved in cell wall biosynthesis